MAMFDASVSSINEIEKSGRANIGAAVKTVFNFSKAV